MPVPPVSFRGVRTGVIAWCVALIVALPLAACTLPPNSANDHPYRDLPGAHGSGGW